LSFLDLAPGDRAVFRRLSLVLGLTTAAEFLVEGVVTSAFLARIGAASLPTALAVRAGAEAVLSLLYERVSARWSARAAMLGAVLVAVLLYAVSAAALGWAAGVWAAYVLASVVARIKTIHFGVLALADLPGPSAGRALPVVFAAGRLGAIAAGPVVTFGGPVLGPRNVVIGAAAVYALSALVLRREPVNPGAAAPPPSGAYSESEGPISISPSQRPPAPGPSAVSPHSRRLLIAIVLGAIALALGRLALTTQSGAILERSYDESELNRVLGLYFIGANVIAMLLQVTVVSRALGGRGLPLLNSLWSLAYLAAQALLVFGPPLVAVALSARLVEGELRNAVRTPVANLLYEAIPPARRAAARTLVIGITVPVASLLGGLGLAALGAHATLLAALGLAAALALVLTSLAQNRAWKASLSSPAAASGAPR